jgi:nucleoside-diphosphate-sugar epimerase
MHYLVTGATGFIGGHLTARLLAEGHLVTALVRTSAQARGLAPYGVRCYIGDVRDKASVRRAMQRVQGVFHLAAYVRVGTSHRRWAEEVNVTGTRNVLEVMRELRVPKGVYTSTLGDRSYLARTLTAHLRGRLPVVPTRTAFCWAHVEDVAVGLLGAMQRGKPGETYMVCGPAYALRDALALVGRLAGKKRPPWSLPGLALLPAAWAVRGFAYALPPLRTTAERLALGAGATHLGTDARARVELGFTPRPLEEGMPETVRDLLQERFSVP